MTRAPRWAWMPSTCACWKSATHRLRAQPALRWTTRRRRASARSTPTCRKLGTQFNQNVLAEVNDSAIVVDSRDELKGMGEEQIAAAAEAAKARGLEGKYVIALLNTTGQPAEAQLENRALRERLHKASVARGSRGNQWDNTGIVSQVLKLRAERATLLGYDTYANYVLADETAANQDNANRLLRQLAPAAVNNARREGADLQAMIDAEQEAKRQPTFQLAPGTGRTTARRCAQQKYNFDESQLKPYFEMKNVLEDGVFFAATKLYGITFKERTDLPKYHPDTWIYDVFDKDGSLLSIFIWDPYARSSKRGGAWMNTYVAQSDLTGDKPVVANHLNIPKPSGRQADADDLGRSDHRVPRVRPRAAWHSLQTCAIRTYSMNVPRDFVEYPSQVNEMWADWPSVLATTPSTTRPASRCRKALLDKVIAASKFNQGFATTEYLEAAMLDQRWHQLPADADPGRRPA
jgi:peptidyl-dipeptidase Dcp